ncbi:family 16 glycosylhydrolase [Pseudonocardia sp. WMMC193]|uniref:glycoside hydrolase family 16 protein n=1 Tax=Pseudonocardia sp. WMMC193 TaxID=2911965 RepID=UPI001F3D0E2E|nr:glycoside hydrolase family 16 protein [Pseudonocardia sp. WMMC193]MCF7553834.1 glycoside hydrolase family 16 protein [Pseudonocardia sp. WMMC193]
MAPGTDGGTSAAERLGWGTPTHAEEFSSNVLRGWGLYDGAGHEGKGRRSPSAVTIKDGVLTITGTANGTTGGMAWQLDKSKYGRWEGRMRAPVGDPDYHALFLLWPDAENWPVGGEVDFMETSAADRQSTDGFLHYGANNSQLHASVKLDVTQWHNWAVEWTDKKITYYVDGVEWFSTTNKETFPPGPMHLAIQLDWFPEGGTQKTTQMQVDWVRFYALPGR